MTPDRPAAPDPEPRPVVRAGGPRPFRPRRWALLLLLFAGLAVAADLFLPAGPFPPRELRVILVQRGETLREVAAELQRVGLLRGPGVPSSRNNALGNVPSGWLMVCSCASARI